MYEYDACVADVEAADYPAGRYFLSNEALNMHPGFIAVLQRRFTITRTLTTVRFPTTQAVSAFRFSGWLSGDFAEFLRTRQKWLFGNVAQKYSARRFSDLAEPPRPVPVEGPKELRFEERFCQAAFDTVPDILQAPGFRNIPRANEAPPLAFAEALARAVQARGLALPGPERSRVVSAAKAHPLPEELRNLGGPQIALLTRQPVEGALQEYRDFLIATGTERELAIAAKGRAAAAYRKLCAQDDPTPAQLAALDDEARRLLASVL